MKDNDPQLEISIFPDCPFPKWGNLRIIVTAASLAKIRNDPRKLEVTQAFLQAAKTLKNCRLSDPGNSEPLLRFQCGETRFMGTMTIADDKEISRFTLCLAGVNVEEEDFSVILHQNNENKSTSGSPPGSPQRNLLQKAVLQSWMQKQSNPAEKEETPKSHLDGKDQP